MSAATIRALSLAIGSISATLTALQDGSEDPLSTAYTARQTALMGAGSVNELIKLIPADYWNVLAVLGSSWPSAQLVRFVSLF